MVKQRGWPTPSGPHIEMVKQRDWPTPSWPTDLDGETEGLVHSFMAHRFRWGNRGVGPRLHGPQI